MPAPKKIDSSWIRRFCLVPWLTLSAHTGGDKPYLISGADDKTVKVIFETIRVATLRAKHSAVLMLVLQVFLLACVPVAMW